MRELVSSHAGELERGEAGSHLRPTRDRPQITRDRPQITRGREEPRGAERSQEEPRGAKRSREGAERSRKGAEIAPRGPLCTALGRARSLP